MKEQARLVVAARMALMVRLELNNPWNLQPLFRFMALVGLVAPFCLACRSNLAMDSAALPEIRLSGLHVWLPVEGSEEALADTGCPFIGLPMDNPVAQSMDQEIRKDLDWSESVDARIAPIARVDLGNGRAGVLVRLVSSAQFFESSIMLYEIDAWGRAGRGMELAGYAQGDSGGWYIESWLSGAMRNGMPESFERIHGFSTPHGDEDVDSMDSRDAYARVSWGAEEIEFQPVEGVAELDLRYPFAGDCPF